MKARFLYIPFHEDENNEQLQFQAITWRQRVYASSKSHKTPTLLVHGEHKLPDVKNPTIYILAHGIDPKSADLVGKTWVVNTSHQNKDTFYINMNEIARRLQNDGLTPKHNARIKLYFCDLRSCAKQIAFEFVEALGENYHTSETTVDFYNRASISIPTQLQNKYTSLFKVAYPFGLTSEDDEKAATFQMAAKRSSQVRERLTLCRRFVLIGKVQDVKQEAKETQRNHKDTDTATPTVTLSGKS